MNVNSHRMQQEISLSFKFQFHFHAVKSRPDSCYLHIVQGLRSVQLSSIMRRCNNNVIGDHTCTHLTSTGRKAAFLTSALLSQVALLKVKTTNKATHLLRNALSSSSTLYEQHYIMYSKAMWVVYLFWLSLALRQTRHKPGQTNQSQA